MNAANGLVEVRVPDMGSFRDVEVIDVLVKPGDTIAIDAPLVTLESEKATMDVPSTAMGVIEKIHTAKGGKVNTGDLVVTVRPDGRPHAMFIWGVWSEGAFWFGTGSKTQKARNLANNPNCIVGTQDAAEAVILEGIAELITDPAVGKKLEPASLRKYGMRGGDSSEPLYRVRPKRVFGLIEKSFPKTATRWTFD